MIDVNYSCRSCCLTWECYPTAQRDCYPAGSRTGRARGSGRPRPSCCPGCSRSRRARRGSERTRRGSCGNVRELARRVSHGRLQARLPECLAACEEKAARHEASPFLDASLKRAELADRDARVFGSKTLEKLLGGAVRFGLKPRHDARPDLFERVLSRTPVPCGLRCLTMSGAGVPFAPSGSEALEEEIEIGISTGKHVDDLSSSQSGQVVLHGANFVEQTQGVERREDCAQAVLHRVRDGLRGEQSRARRRRRVIALPDPRPVSRLGRELERRLTFAIVDPPRWYRFGNKRDEATAGAR